GELPYEIKKLRGMRMTFVRNYVAKRPGVSVGVRFAESFLSVNFRRLKSWALSDILKKKCKL
ncbi:MAG: hypothetical protein WCD89_25465, partial [Anaerocolumna sp.]